MAPILAWLSAAALLPALSFAQSTTTTHASSASTATASTTSGSSTAASSTSTGYPSATLAVDQGSKGYTYAGCFNETQGYANGGGVRALSGGTMNATDKMTPEWCFNFCGDVQYAGLEYGRECWCAPYLSSLSTELPEGACGIPCKANETEACGGSWALSLYNRTSGAAGGFGGEAGRRAVWSAAVVAAMTAAAGLMVGL
ncbi:WSC domain containing protein [Neofusicoccum parvum]|uniref:WSC domain containing protein n=1 Tax=Neofusicoccum parvum TaxID=310453 RepID=A0ACB5RUZ2_9PEZI|nr:WSC domain containing protein [Neofusicoccum parvum]